MDVIFTHGNDFHTHEIHKVRSLYSFGNYFERTLQMFKKAFLSQVFDKHKPVKRRGLNLFCKVNCIWGQGRCFVLDFLDFHKQIKRLNKFSDKFRYFIFLELAFEVLKVFTPDKVTNTFIEKCLHRFLIFGIFQ